MTEKGWIELLIGRAGLTVFLLLLCAFMWQLILNLQADNVNKEIEKDLLHEKTLTYIMQNTHAVQANTEVMKQIAEQLKTQNLTCGR
jgi:hypothetical protein